jgi:multidrug efflux pump subunit AcrA (membrane-fusion protein)
VDGIIKDILVKKGVQVDSDDLLVIMESRQISPNEQIFRNQ